jgi:hypothetical protein
MVASVTSFETNVTCAQKFANPCNATCFDVASFAPLMRRQPAASVKRFTDSALPPG